MKPVGYGLWVADAVGGQLARCSPAWDPHSKQGRCTNVTRSLEIFTGRISYLQGYEATDYTTHEQNSNVSTENGVQYCNFVPFYCSKSKLIHKNYVKYKTSLAYRM
jgi:hypothetical protein